jgi:RecB family exonuclease
MQPPIKSWSFSVLRDFEQCPYKVYLAKVEKAPQPEVGDDPDHPLIRGDRIHKEAEAFIKGEGELTKDLRKFRSELERLAEIYPEGNLEVEKKWGFTRDWEPCDFFDSNVWLRVICDFVEHSPEEPVLFVGDHKTGKSFGKEVPHRQQQQLYGIAALMKYPDKQIASSQMWYLDEGKKSAIGRYDRHSIAPLLQRWTSRAEKMTGALTFPAKPNRSNCRFCPYSPNEAGNGRCPYGVEVQAK